MRIPSKSLAIVLARSAGLCEACGAVGTNTHHRRPRGSGGSKDPATNRPSNLLRLCGSGTTACHGHIEANRRWAYDLGLLVRQNASPAEVPVLLLRPGWVYLDDFGNYLPAERGAA